MKKLVIVAVVCGLAAPAAAIAQQPAGQQSPSQLCAAQRTAMGTAGFGSLYGTNGGTSDAFGKCVAKLASAQRQNQATAAQQCQAQKSGAQEKNAFGKCVSQKAQALTAQQQAATVNAARSCRAEQSAGAAAFAAKYGTNGRKSNAFGKCVLQKAHA